MYSAAPVAARIGDRGTGIFSGAIAQWHVGLARLMGPPLKASRDADSEPRKKVVDLHLDVPGNLAHERRRDVSTLVKRDCRAAPARKNWLVARVKTVPATSPDVKKNSCFSRGRAPRAQASIALLFDRSARYRTRSATGKESNVDTT